MNPHRYLSDLELHGVKLGLANIAALLAAMGHPETAFPAIHIAGTNGKGSVAAMTDAILRAAGYRVGRYTSPHLVDVRERFTCSGELISEDAFASAIAAVRRAAESLGHPPTYFEAATAAAFHWFAETGVDMAVVEVGMGGRFDATNVCRPIACAITPIDFDHMQYLGDTLGKIAFEKAGILKEGVPAVVSEQRAEALDVIVARAKAVGAPLRLCGREFRYECGGVPLAPLFTHHGDVAPLGPVALGLAGRYQCANAAVAVELARLCAGRFDRIDDGAILRGLAAATWPCRLECVLDDPPVIIDVAHNPAGAAQLAANIGRAVFVLGVSADKDAAGMIAALAPKAEAVIATQYAGRRAMAAADLAVLVPPGVEVRIVPDLAEALATGLALASPSAPLVVTGSVFTAGEARDLLVRRHRARPMRF